MNLKPLLIKSLQAAIEAGTAILEIYRSDFSIEEKADNSPLTLADKRSHDVISHYLSEFKIPILSEEGKSIPYEERRAWDTFWLVDPLDGTKEFIKKNGEFTVNIAIVRKRRPHAGVICIPDKKVIYFAAENIGAYRIEVDKITSILNAEVKKSRNHQLAELLRNVTDQAQRLPIPRALSSAYKIIGSRSHATPELEMFVQEKRLEYGSVQFISAGSSLKFCLVAEGKADIYPRLGLTMEWDTAAGQAVVENAGGRVLGYETNEPLIYNKKNLLNPWFIVSREAGNK